MATTDRDRPDSLSVTEMLRIMDVATALRQDREVVEEQLDLGTLKERLKERMIAASKVTGETVTPEEVDAAIDQYYARLHTFQEPPWSPSIALAHLWVARWKVFGWGGAIALACLLIYPMFAVQGYRRIDAMAAQVENLNGRARAIVLEESVKARLVELSAQAKVFRKEGRAESLEPIRDELENLIPRLLEEYKIVVVSGSKSWSAIDRTPKNGGKPSYYLIVEAKKSDGTILKRQIRDETTDRNMEVSTWAERVPESVFNRLKEDKAEDGILDETAFAVKKRGFTDLTVTMPDENGKPLARMGQITEW